MIWIFIDCLQRTVHYTRYLEYVDKQDREVLVFGAHILGKEMDKRKEVKSPIKNENME